jgi:DNA (cytosine-5)-methyltransferase 1
MLNGLDLFSGIGGISLALAPWVRPIAYCERDQYAASVLISRMLSGDLSVAPIWDDVRTLKGCYLPPDGVDIIYGGFPCQDISIAGHGKGLAGERSGLFREIIRLCREIRPSFIFLENVPAIAFRGLGDVVSEISAMGYDCRWTVMSAGSLGACHLRERWWLLAYSNIIGQKKGIERDSVGLSNLPNFKSERKSTWTPKGFIEPRVDRVGNGIFKRLDRIGSLGNAVVPIQAREAFKLLMGMR